MGFHEVAARGDGGEGRACLGGQYDFVHFCWAALKRPLTESCG